ncbi:probable LRR receptor-like serine/threonine-protein kinase At3g47570 [Chenopodium quinoa]|uniref:probable LRR receptor-like serine/threonine-protein kinase At3g47570 n=1 Tax=Chenopodium quinoa TaxID=63459 RepID=UPI000B770747|nr:probable LRR receptor-like serine/threonine-protein kinase At3g47570 [Chenopodium quinoa]
MGGNFFSGSIPKSFKYLASMSALNLSHNKLSGPIPSFFANFSLEELDLSFNNFEGKIPKEGVFANINTFSILGNNKLCGGIPELHLQTCPIYATPKRKKGKLSIYVIEIIAVASLVVGVSILSLGYFLLGLRWKQNKTSGGSELNLVEHFSKVTYDMLLKATNRFSEANLLGVGRFGSVYKGVLDRESNMVVAVKVISLEQRGATKSFMAECAALRSIRHRNLLKIVTVCSSNDFKALVYVFMKNGSLHQWIHTDPNLRTLSLLQRVKIAIDVASALDYLHNACDEPIIHCDLKPSNILLDDDMVAHVGDFGLARFHLRASANNSSSVAIKGTVGYAAPEYGVGSMVSKEGDVYSYGIVLLELMTSINPTDWMFEGGLDLHNHAKSATLLPNQLINIIDPRLLDNDVGNASERNDGELLAENERKIFFRR